MYSAFISPPFPLQGSKWYLECRKIPEMGKVRRLREYRREGRPFGHGIYIFHFSISLNRIRIEAICLISGCEWWQLPVGGFSKHWKVVQEWDFLFSLCTLLGCSKCRGSWPSQITSFSPMAHIIFLALWSQDSMMSVRIQQSCKIRVEGPVPCHSRLSCHLQNRHTIWEQVQVCTVPLLIQIFSVMHLGKH